MFASIISRWPKTLVGGAGVLGACGLGIFATEGVVRADSPPSALNPAEWRSFELIKKEDLTHNTSFFRFALPDSKQVVGLPVASCLLTKAPTIKADGSPGVIIRPYTPTSAPDAKGHFDLVIKVYEQGKMTQYLKNMKVGDTLECKGPIMKIKYEPNIKKEIGMVAGGTGITPMLQVADEILRNPADKTKVSLLFANVSEDDIILKSKIDEMAKKHDNFQVYYVIDKVSPANASTWKGGVGYITKDMLKEHMPAPGPDSWVFVCGPPPMMNVISGPKAEDKSQGELAGLLKGLGYTSDMVYKF